MTESDLLGQVIRIAAKVPQSHFEMLIRFIGKEMQTHDPLSKLVRVAMDVQENKIETLINIAEKFKKGNIYRDLWELRLKEALNGGEKSFAAAQQGVVELKLNNFGHVTFEISGLDLSGDEEFERLRIAGHDPCDYDVQEILFSDSYNEDQKLSNGEKCTIVLVPFKNKETPSDFLEHLENTYGYSKILAGAVPRICETISKNMIKEMGFTSILGFHDPIDGDGDHYHQLLRISYYGNERKLYSEDFYARLDGNIACACLEVKK